MTTPFEWMTAEKLNELYAFFTDNPSVESVEMNHDGILVHVTERDLRFIHDEAPLRFGNNSEVCAICMKQTRRWNDAIDVD
jgi:hypothetical protein